MTSPFGVEHFSKAEPFRLKFKPIVPKKPTGPGSLRSKLDPTAWETRIAAKKREGLSKAKHLNPVFSEQRGPYLPKHSPGMAAARQAAANPKTPPLGPAIRNTFRATRFGKRMGPGHAGRLQAVAAAHRGNPTAASRYANTRLLLSSMGPNSSQVQRNYAKDVLDQLANPRPRHAPTMR